MRRQALFVSAIILGLILLPILSLAQEDTTENIEYSFGTIANVNDIDAGKFVVKEYAYDKDADVEVTYSADPSATLENINSLKDIAVGDMAELSYVVDADGNRTAKIIRIFKSPTNPGPSQEGIAPGEAAPEASTPEAVSPEPTSPEPTP